MKSIDSIIITKQTIESLYDQIVKIPYSDLEGLKPVLALKYSSAIDEMKMLFNVTSMTSATITEKPKAEPEVVLDDVNTEEEELEDDDFEDETPIDDQRQLSPNVTLTSSSPWLKVKSDVVWRHDPGTINQRFAEGFMISADGDVWDIMQGKIIEPYWKECDLRITIPRHEYELPIVDREVRVSTMVCRAFKVYSNTKNENRNMVIAFKDGNRRNLTYTNLEWVEFSQQMSNQKLTVHDICQRLVEFNGEVEPTAEKCGMPANVVTDIRFKLTEINISDQYFTIDANGDFIPGAKTAEETVKIDIKEIIESKLKIKTPLSMEEKIFLITDKFDELQAENKSKKKKGKITAEIVVDEIRDQYKVNIPTDLANKIMGGMSK